MDRIPTARRPLLAGALILLAAGAAYWAWGPDRTTAPVAAASTAQPGRLDAAQMARLGIRTEPAQAAGAVPLGTVPGLITLPPDARVAVTSPFAGTAVRVLVVPGQQVRQGEALAVVRAPETVQFGAELARADADLAFARANAARLDTLAREGVIAGVRADEARAALRRAEATRRENGRLLGLAGAGSDGTVTLRAPIAGRVATVAIDPGTPLGPAAAAPFVIENDTALALDLQLPERLAHVVRPGMLVTLVSDASTPSAPAGRIISVAPSLDPQTRSVTARASLPGGAAPGLVPGKGVTAVISDAADAARPGVSVPAAAVVRIDGADYVFVQAGARFVRRQVDVAADAGGRAVLSGGLRAGEAVAVSGMAELKAMLAGH